MNQSIKLKEVFYVKPDVLYRAWLDSDTHSNMTGGKAHCTSELEQPFTAWDGYISGKNIELVENQKIVQTWRTTEFNESDKDSILTIELMKISAEQTELVLTHTNIPHGQTQYEKGWIEHYLNPMKGYFEKTPK